ncbi:hypothetical protein B0H17DRAFT_1129248 [Mycena rosella]|uniref:Uncharacterized protein n=1 Tax=Mycena rosella TaxID=1033263 RepID=A0AAD7DUV8_MYCRO|nr:hypothetical protein B0H17DRAFT_1129248 [Mycena rosella]
MPVTVKDSSNRWISADNSETTAWWADNVRDGSKNGNMDEDSPPTPPRLSLKFQVFLQPLGTYPDAGARQASAGHLAVKEAAVTVLSHLVHSPDAQAHLAYLTLAFFMEHPPAKDAFQSKVPHTRPPNIVLVAPEDLDRGLGTTTMAWGMVRTGTGDGAAWNEIFLPIDLAEHLELNPSTPASRQRQCVWSVAYSHELVHGLAKDLFSDAVAPLLSGAWLGQDGAERSPLFESLYFGFTCQVEWKDTDVLSPDRMDKIVRLLAKRNEGPMFSMTPAVGALLDSFHSEKIRTPTFENKKPYRCTQPGSHRRCTVGSGSLEEAVEQEGEGNDSEGEQQQRREVTPPPASPAHIRLGIGMNITCCRVNDVDESWY